MSNFEILGLPTDELDVFLAAAHGDPFRVLGPHRVGDNLVVRTFRPDAREVRVVLEGDSGQSFPANRLDRDGFFQAVLPGMRRDVAYQLSITGWGGEERATRHRHKTRKGAG